MSPTQDQYRELVALTQLYLFQEHTVSDRVFDAPETFEYFLKQAQKKNVNTVQEQKDSSFYESAAKHVYSKSISFTYYFKNKCFDSHSRNKFTRLFSSFTKTYS